MSGRRVLGFLVARPLIAVAIAALVVGVLLLLQTHKQTTPVTHRTSTWPSATRSRRSSGASSTRRRSGRTGRKIVSSGAEYAEVQRVAKRIEAVAGRDKPAFVWRVTLLRKNEANAYCLPGGKIVVYTGILPVTRNDAGLATVLGHEVAHATAEHAAERIEREHLTKVAAAIIAGGVAFTPGQYVRVAALLGAAAQRSLPFSRSAGVRGGPHRPRLHGEGGVRPARGRGVLAAHAAGVEGQGAARVRERPPERRAPDRADRNGCPRPSARTRPPRRAEVRTVTMPRPVSAATTYCFTPRPAAELPRRARTRARPALGRPARRSRPA